MIELYLEVSDVIRVYEHKQYANCALHVNFWISWLLPFCLMMEKDHFKQKFLVWLQVPFKVLNFISQSLNSDLMMF